MLRSAERVSPAPSVTSALIWNTKVGSSFSGTLGSGLAANSILNEPSVAVLAVPWAISWLSPLGKPPRHQPHHQGIRTSRTTRYLTAAPSTAAPFQAALAHVSRLVSIPEFHGFVLPGGCAGWHGRASHTAVREMNIRFHSGIPAGIQYLSSNYSYNRRQSIAPYLKSKWGRLVACGGPRGYPGNPPGAPVTNRRSA